VEAAAPEPALAEPVAVPEPVVIAPEPVTTAMFQEAPVEPLVIAPPIEVAPPVVVAEPVAPAPMAVVEPSVMQSAAAKTEQPKRVPKRLVRVETKAERDLAVLAASLKSLEPLRTAAAPTAAPAPDLSNVLTAIQRDLKQLQPVHEAAAEAPRPGRKRTLESLPTPLPVEAPAAPTPIESRTKGSSTKKTPTRPKPAVDEWGLFDPEQCGIAALIAKLDEINEQDEKKTKKRA
jgi:hypothetical protein